MAAARRASPAHGRHAAVALWRWSGRGAAQRWAGQTRAGLGWAEARWAGVDAGRGGRPSRLQLWAEKGGGGPRKEKSIFQFSIFKEISNSSFQISF